ncbi:MAG TPA: hypothetical protein VGU64_19330 [Terriglobales bacterium]|nr:hypothetical protein [Terriglobales bacterium]
MSVESKASDPATKETASTKSTDLSSPYQPPVSAPLFNSQPNEPVALAATGNGGSGINDLAKILGDALRTMGTGIPTRTGSLARPAWDRRKVLVCSSPAYRQTIAGLLAERNYDVYVADNMAQALGRMREDRMDVIVLDANFDPVEQGVAFVTREVKLLRPSERRRLFVVYLSSSVRTMDLHAAFLHNVNLVINPSDIDQLPDALEVSIRHYNELYRDFNRTLEVPPI